MDVAARRSFWSAAGEYVSDGRSLLFATHRLEEADKVADRIVVMASGRLVADGTPDAVKAIARGRGAVSFRSNGTPIVMLERLPAVEEVELARGRASLRTAPALAQERATGWLRQLRVTPLPAAATVAGKVAAAMAYALPAIALVGVAAAVTQGVELGLDRWVELTLLLWVATAPFAALGVL
jgi:ABC-type sulfate/molybdate transport systems ATPase subunit